MDTFFELFFGGLRWLIHGIQPLLVPICFVAAWGIVGITAWNLWASIRDGVQRAQQMHRVPCSECRFFTGDYHLKCTVHPDMALSEEAIDCPDYEPLGSLVRLSRTP
ncbi:hypothetical protein ACQ4M4_17670 [Leptolyngbya sp. AN02str]|uniref:hypothetical protein n=1 Tax=Leptolyngbya sp. AN02str TaxID=3423363 RepID=UPI003D320BC4